MNLDLKNKEVNCAQKSDQELMQDLAKDDLAAWSELVQRYGNLVYSIAFQILKNKNDTEDAVQNTFIRLKIYSNKFDTSLPLKPWISKIASHVAIRYYNKKKNLNKKESTRLEPQNIPQGSFNVSENMEQKELAHMINKAIEMLPEVSRVAITLYYIGGMSQSEIAKELGLSQFSISEKINASLEKIRNTLKKSGIHASAILTPELLQKILSSQSLPGELGQHLGQNLPTNSDIAGVNTNVQLEGKVLLQKFSTTFWLVISSAIILPGAIIWFSLKHYAEEKPNITLISSQKQNEKQTDSDKNFLPVDLKNYFPICYEPNQKTGAFDTPELHDDTAMTLGKPSWKIIDSTNGPVISRQSDDLNSFDGLYLKKDYTKPQIFTGSIKVNGNNNKLTFIMTTPTDQKRVYDINDKNSPIVFKKIISKITTVEAGKGIEVDFRIYLFPYKNKLISIALIHCKGYKYSTIVTRFIDYTNSCFKLGFVSNGNLSIVNFKNCELNKNWDYQKEKEILFAARNLPVQFLDNILTKNQQEKFNN